MPFQVIIPVAILFLIIGFMSGLNANKGTKEHPEDEIELSNESEHEFI